MASLDLFVTDWREVWRGHEPEGIGSVYTKPHVVETILDLVGYTSDADLAHKRLLEPSCGDGAFLRVIVERLLDSARRRGDESPWQRATFRNAVVATDISAAAVQQSREFVRTELVRAGCPSATATALAGAWVRHCDFLLEDWDGAFDYVVGNPPYVRLEDLPKPVLASYRRASSVLTDRADVYVAFIERGLSLLAGDGVLGFITANRFAKNQYGASLRSLIASRYRVQYYLNLEHTQPFENDVSAYPAITVLDRRHGLPTRAATLTDCSPETLTAVRRGIGEVASEQQVLGVFEEWYPDGAPWRTTSVLEAGFFKWLESRFPLLEDSAPGTRVGIGVATGADAVFILPAKSPSIEGELQLPLAMAQDVRGVTLRWSGHYVINPFSEGRDGELVSLSRYSGLAAHLEEHAQPLRARHVAKTRPQSWYRTIDRIWPGLVREPKLLLPDIQMGGVAAYDSGQYYPHHNLYWLTSTGWDLRVLQAILRSSLVQRQVRAYSVQMRGGAVRFQAQTLRRVRVPAFRDIDSETREALRNVAESPAQEAIDDVVDCLFGYSA